MKILCYQAVSLETDTSEGAFSPKALFAVYHN
jgi:hypothetical protein